MNMMLGGSDIYKGNWIGYLAVLFGNSMLQKTGFKLEHAVSMLRQMIGAFIPETVYILKFSLAVKVTKW